MFLETLLGYLTPVPVFLETSAVFLETVWSFLTTDLRFTSLPQTQTVYLRGFLVRGGRFVETLPRL